MPVSPARAAAFDILLEVERRQAYASELLHSPRLEPLSPTDRGLTMELVMGVLRWRSRLDAAIVRHSFTPFGKLDLEVLTALRLGAYQLLWLERIPKSAAVNQSVELVKRAHKQSAVPLANAVLRKIGAGPKQRDSAVDADSSTLTPGQLAQRYAHPEWMVERWAQFYGIAATAEICRYNQQIPPTHLRLCADAVAVERELEEAGVQLQPGRLLNSARRVVSGEVTRTAAFTEGRVFLQDEASQLVAALVGRGERLLDCCAAPGGKTAAMAERNPQATVVAADLHPHRARLMSRLLRAPNVRIMAADATALPLMGAFDRVLADVPCSGTGTLARNPEIKWRLKLGDLTDLQPRQSAILHSALQHLAPGGRLVYSSCSLEPEENLAVVEQALARGGVKLVHCGEELARLRGQGELAWESIEALLSGPYLRTLPGVHPGDGFFAALLENC